MPEENQTIGWNLICFPSRIAKRGANKKNEEKGWRECKRLQKKQICEAMKASEYNLLKCEAGQQ